MQMKILFPFVGFVTIWLTERNSKTGLFRVLFLEYLKAYRHNGEGCFC